MTPVILLFVGSLLFTVLVGVGARMFNFEADDEMVAWLLVLLMIVWFVLLVTGLYGCLWSLWAMGKFASEAVNR